MMYLKGKRLAISVGSFYTFRVPSNHFNKYKKLYMCFKDEFHYMNNKEISKYKIYFMSFIYDLYMRVKIIK